MQHTLWYGIYLYLNLKPEHIKDSLQDAVLVHILSSLAARPP